MSSQSSSSILPSTSSQPQTAHPALVLTDVLVEIFSHVATPQELLHYRLVCKKWNDVIVHTLVKKRKNDFPLRLRYGPEVLRYLFRSGAERWTIEILKSPTMILTGTTTPLSFDTVVVDDDFYLAGVNPQWQQFLAIYAKSIRHIKFNIRSGKEQEENSHYVMDCNRVVSTENLRSAFSAISNLESLVFSVRFSDYGKYSGYDSERIFPRARRITDLPQLKKLTKITIQEPHGVEYGHRFMKDILGMAPNMTTLYIKYSRDLSNFASALRALPDLISSLTTLGISILGRGAPFSDFDIEESGFLRFRLTKLELNGISWDGEDVEEFLESQSSTLTSLILGDRVSTNRQLYHSYYPGPFLRFGEIEDHRCNPFYHHPLSLPPRMDSLEILEVNLSKFKLAPISNYQTQFPALEELTFSSCEDTRCFWTYQQLHGLVPRENGSSHTVKKFSLFGPISDDSDRINIISAVQSTFPVAEHRFGL